MILSVQNWKSKTPKKLLPPPTKFLHSASVNKQTILNLLEPNIPFLSHPFMEILLGSQSFLNRQSIYTTFYLPIQKKPLSNEMPGYGGSWFGPVTTWSYWGISYFYGPLKIFSTEITWTVSLVQDNSAVEFRLFFPGPILILISNQSSK